MRFKRNNFCSTVVAILFLIFTPNVFSQTAAEQDDEWYIGKRIRDITFEGLRHVKQKDLDGVTESFIGKNFTDDIFLELQGQLYGLELFDVIEPNAVPSDTLGTELVIRFKVTERPVVSRINFVNNKGLRRNEILDVVTLKINDVVNQLKIRLDEQAILNKYLEKGYPDITVRTEQVYDNNGNLVVNFILNEGERITIESIHFEGNSVFSEKNLQGILTLKPKALFTDGAFQEAKLIADRAAIAAYYHDRGYIDAEITDLIRDIRHDDKGSHLILTFRINEGLPFVFGGITFEGNHIFSTANLEKLVKSKKGETLNAGRLEMDLQSIQDIYYENGYIFNGIDRQENRDNTNRTISYNILIVERGRAHIEHIYVRGNKKTKDHVITREIPLEPGDVFSKTKIMNGLRNLYNLQYFSSVVPDTPPGSTESLMDLIVNVEEQYTTDIQAGLTFSGSNDPKAFPISALFKWNDRNFLGRGNAFGAEVNVSPDVQNISAQYTQRWLFGLPLSGGFDLTVQHAQRLAAMDNIAPFFEGNEPFAFPDGFSSFRDYEAAGKLPPDAYLMTYEQWSISMGFSTGYRFLTPLGILNLGGTIRFGVKYNDFNSDIYRPFDRSIRNRNGEWTPANSVAFTVSLDQRDLYYDPSKGYYISDRFGVYGLFGNLEIEKYLRNDLKLEWFWTLWNWQMFEKWAFKGVIGLHTGLSMIFPQAGDPMPIIEDANKLSIDGMFVGRGWTGERLNRGHVMWENWAELRIPALPGILSVDLFFDAATKRPLPGDVFTDVSSEGYHFYHDMRYSFGGGLRFAMPQFPFRFLFAKRFKHKDNGDIEWVQGAIGGNGDPASGVDFVISFAVSTY
ncbi:outer membrane protein assembly factor BamA [Spirochaetia bacterium]|nr:outer membrane protein assembly factor BamA [Spirochaetia bacterium]